MAKEKISEAKPVINDLIFKELIKRGYSLEGKTRVWNIADSKLWYLTPDQAQAFLDLEEKDPKQKMFLKKEVELIKAKFNELFFGSAESKINIVDLGCGDGVKARAFIDSFKDKSLIRYCPIDISEYMVNKTISTFSKMKELNILKLKNNVIDFLDFKKIESSLRQGDFKTNYILLLGGSLENSDAHELLHEIRSSMNESDVLLIGNKLTHPNPEKMVEYYTHNDCINSMLIKTIEQLGLNTKKVKYGARYHGNRIEMYYTINEDIALSSNDKKIDFAKGDKIIVTISYKYDKQSLSELLMMYFSNVQVITTEDGSYALALCKK